MRGSAPAHTGAPGFGHECGIAPACILGHVVVQVQYGFVAVDVASRLVDEARIDHDRSIDRDQVVAQAIKETRAAVCAPVAVTRCVGKMGQQFLGDRTRKAMEIIKKFREAQFRLAAADKLFIKAKRALPAAEKAELAAKTKRDAAQPSLTAPTALVKTHTDAHNQTLQVLTNAENKATADCTQTSQSYNTWWQAVQSKRLPALQALAEAQLAWLQAEPDQRPALEQKRTQAAQTLARINEEIKRHRTQLDTHLQAGLNSDQAESAAQSRQARRPGYRRAL